MISTHLNCRKCGSVELVKNGKNAVGNPKFKCKICNFSGVITSRRFSEETKELLAKSYLERSSLRAVARIFSVSPHSVARWIKKKQ